MGKLGGDAIVVISLIWALIPLAGMFAGVMIQRFRTQERLRCIEKGVPLPPFSGRPALSPKERIAAMRIAGILCVSTSLGLFVLFGALAATIPQFAKGVMAVPAIPLFLGAGFLIEYRIRRKEAQTSSVVTQ